MKMAQWIIGVELGRSWLDLASTDWISVLEDRPEVMLRRDGQSSAAYLRDVLRPEGHNTVEVSVGDVFSDISNSIIATRGSRIEGAIRNASDRVDADVAEALRAMGEHVAKAESAAAVTDLEELTNEISQAEPNKSRLRVRWEALVSVLPGIMTLTDAVAKVTSLFS